MFTRVLYVLCFVITNFFYVQDRFINGEEIGKLDCGHIFHMDCIKLWLARKNLCPLCKRRGLVFY